MKRSKRLVRVIRGIALETLGVAACLALVDASRVAPYRSVSESDTSRARVDFVQTLIHPFLPWKACLAEAEDE